MGDGGWCKGIAHVADASFDARLLEQSTRLDVAERTGHVGEFVRGACQALTLLLKLHRQGGELHERLVVSDDSLAEVLTSQVSRRWMVALRLSTQASLFRSAICRLSVDGKADLASTLRLQA